MPRPRRFPKPPKVQPEPVAYRVSEEVTSVAATLMARFEAHYMALRQFRIAYLVITGGREPKRDRIDGVWAGIRKPHPTDKLLHATDLILWVRETIWKKLDAKQREALVAHQLDHFTTSDKGELVAQKHDVEDFAFVARNWGAWHENVQLFGRQLKLFENPEAAKNGHDQAFADIDAKVAEQREERAGDNVTPLRRPSTSTDQPQA